MLSPVLLEGAYAWSVLRDYGLCDMVRCLSAESEGASGERTSQPTARPVLNVVLWV